MRATFHIAGGRRARRIVIRVLDAVALRTRLAHQPVLSVIVPERPAAHRVAHLHEVAFAIDVVRAARSARSLLLAAVTREVVAEQVAGRARLRFHAAQRVVHVAHHRRAREARLVELRHPPRLVIFEARRVAVRIGDRRQVVTAVVGVTHALLRARYALQASVRIAQRQAAADAVLHPRQQVPAPGQHKPHAIGLDIAARLARVPVELPDAAGQRPVIRHDAGPRVARHIQPHRLARRRTVRAVRQTHEHVAVQAERRHLRVVHDLLAEPALRGHRGEVSVRGTRRVAQQVQRRLVLHDGRHRIERQPAAHAEKPVGRRPHAHVEVVRPPLAQRPGLVFQATAVEPLESQCSRRIAIAGLHVLVLIHEVAEHHVDRVAPKRAVDLLLALRRLRIGNRHRVIGDRRNGFRRESARQPARDDRAEQPNIARAQHEIPRAAPRVFGQLAGRRNQQPVALVHIVLEVGQVRLTVGRQLRPDGIEVARVRVVDVLALAHRQIEQSDRRDGRHTRGLADRGGLENRLVHRIAVEHRFFQHRVRRHADGRTDIAGQIDVGRPVEPGQAHLVMLHRVRIRQTVGNRRALRGLRHPLRTQHAEARPQHRLTGVGIARRARVLQILQVALRQSASRRPPAIDDEVGPAAPDMLVERVIRLRDRIGVMPDDEAGDAVRAGRDRAAGRPHLHPVEPEQRLVRGVERDRQAFAVDRIRREGLVNALIAHPHRRLEVRGNVAPFLGRPARVEQRILRLTDRSAIERYDRLAAHDVAQCGGRSVFPDPGRKVARIRLQARADAVAIQIVDHVVPDVPATLCGGLERLRVVAGCHAEIDAGLDRMRLVGRIERVPRAADIGLDPQVFDRDLGHRRVQAGTTAGLGRADAVDGNLRLAHQVQHGTHVIGRQAIPVGELLRAEPDDPAHEAGVVTRRAQQRHHQLRLIEGTALIVEHRAERAFVNAAHRVDFDVVAHELVDQVRVIAQRTGEFVDRGRPRWRIVRDDATRARHAAAFEQALFRLREVLQVNVAGRTRRTFAFQLRERPDRAVEVDLRRHLARRLRIVRRGLFAAHRRHDRPHAARLRRELLTRLNRCGTQ
ncbi:hypothetical protein LMG29542_06200 [Paraburkholderia humisilvae]|uniref:Uncharacterized protein n=1 Tax=Paraburkholderia humisilvae TaxID=627669 RepID=A0A6J5EUT7_9BURK|nr:hypothetical protein LMG29542_06200 [Paraburkholderia humisilvae]